MISKLLTTFCCLAEKSNLTAFSLKSVVLTFVLVSGFGAHAQVSSYVPNGTAGVAAPAWVDLPVAGVSLFGLTWNDQVATNVPLGMNFNFNGNDYATCSVSANGFITFGTVAPLGTNYNPISSTAAYDGAISIMAGGLTDGMRSNNSAIRYLTQGTAPNRTFTVEYVGFRSSNLSIGTYSSQIILHESAVGNPTAGRIELRYKNTPIVGTLVNVNLQIGLRGEKNHDFNNRTFTNATAFWNTPTLLRGTANTSTVVTRTSVPSINQIHNLTFDPPACFAPKATRAVALGLTNTSADIAWTASTPAPANGYQYMLVAGGAPANINAGSPNFSATSPFMGTTAAGVTTANVTGLTGGQLYQIYVRSNCGAYGGWSAAGSFTTLCDPVVIAPLSGAFYEENFNTLVPPCIKTENIGDGNNWFFSNPSVPAYGFATRHMRILTQVEDNNAWFFTRGVTLTAGQSYRFAYKYGATEELPYTEQRLVVTYGSAPVASTMQMGAALPGPYPLALAQYPILKGGPYLNVINFTVPTTGTYYFGFNDQTFGGNGSNTLVDDIDIRESTCFPGTVNPVTGITSGSATISWTPPASIPTGGYEYYYTSGAAPDATTVPLGTTTSAITTASITGLSPSTLYCVYVRSNCGSGDLSAWSVAECFTTLAGVAPATCNPSGAGYAQDPQGITNVTFSNVNNTTGIEANNYGNYAYLTGYASQGATNFPVSITYRTGYTYDTQIWVDWNSDGTFGAGELVYTGASGGSVPATLVATFNIPGGATIGPHRMRIGGIDSPIFTGGALTPCRVGAYQAFEDYTLWVTAPSPLVTVTPTATTTCLGTAVNVTLTSAVGNYTNYTWEPATGVSGTAPNFVLNPTVSTVYVLTGSNAAFPFTRNTATVNITVNNAPSAVAISPATLTVCQNAVAPLAPLTITGGIISGVPVYTENFNGSAPGWVQTNGTTPPGAAADLASWGLYPAGSAPTYTVINSNDNSQFALTDSDAPGGGSTTFTTLTSPNINLTSYTAASLSFYEFYDAFSNDAGDESGTIEITTNGGTTWTTLLVHDGTADVGTASNFANTIINLTPYINTTINIRFRYNATYDWSWAIDNFEVTGSATSTITWSPTTGLYTDAGGTNAYTGGAANTVYPRPATTTNYTATATAFSCDVASPPMTVTVTNIAAGTISTANQNVCTASEIVPIVSTGAAGNWIWQWSTNAAFTVPNDITGSNNLTTLTTALIGPITATRYYRIFATATGCSDAISSPVHSITFSSTTWGAAFPPFPGWSNGTPDASKQAVFNANYTVDIVNTPTSVINACSLTVNPGVTVTVNSGFTVRVTNNVTVSGNGRFIFENDASLVQINNTVNSGDITYKRITTPIRKFDYTYWSSPVNAQTLLAVSPDTQPDKFYWFNTTTYQWTSIAAPAISTMTPGRGYIIRGPNVAPYNASADFFPTLFGKPTAVATGGGVPNNGDINISVGWNSAINNLDCIGNPYPSAIDADLLMLYGPNTVAGGGPLPNGGTTLYFWTHNTPIGIPVALNYNQNDYALYNLSGGAGTRAALSSPCVGCNNNVPNGNIAAGQGFMIVPSPNATVANPPTAPSRTLHFTNAMRLVGLNNQFFRMSGEQSTPQSLERNRVWLEISNATGAYKQMMVGYIENATNDIDSGFDGEMVDAGNPVSLYTLVNNTKLTIQGKALPFDINDQIPIGYKSTTAGTFQINLGNFDGLFTDTGVYLEDTTSGNIYDLKQNAYTFATEAGTFNTRFILRFTSSSLSTNQNTFNSSDAVVYKNNRSIFIETPNVNMKSVQIYDLRGRLVAEQNTINASKAAFTNLNVAQQVLLVHITSNDNVTVTKKIVF